MVPKLALPAVTHLDVTAAMDAWPPKRSIPLAVVSADADPFSEVEL
jgi:hypothetical protein